MSRRGVGRDAAATVSEPPRCAGAVRRCPSVHQARPHSSPIDPLPIAAFFPCSTCGSIPRLFRYNRPLGCSRTSDACRGCPGSGAVCCFGRRPRSDDVEMPRPGEGGGGEPCGGMLRCIGADPFVGRTVPCSVWSHPLPTTRVFACPHSHPCTAPRVESHAHAAQLALIRSGPSCNAARCMGTLRVVSHRVPHLGVGGWGDGCEALPACRALKAPPPGSLCTGSSVVPPPPASISPRMAVLRCQCPPIDPSPVRVWAERHHALKRGMGRDAATTVSEPLRCAAVVRRLGLFRCAEPPGHSHVSGAHRVRLGLRGAGGVVHMSARPPATSLGDGIPRSRHASGPHLFPPELQCRSLRRNPRGGELLGVAPGC